jgi:hypothetical protein
MGIENGCDQQKDAGSVQKMPSKDSPGRNEQKPERSNEK